MTFFVQKFNDPILDEHLLQIFFGKSLDQGLTRLDRLSLADPHFYSFEYNGLNIIGESDQTRSMRST